MWPAQTGVEIGERQHGKGKQTKMSEARWQRLLDKGTKLRSGMDLEIHCLAPFQSSPCCSSPRECHGRSSVLSLLTVCVSHREDFAFLIVLQGQAQLLQSSTAPVCWKMFTTEHFVRLLKLLSGFALQLNFSHYLPIFAYFPFQKEFPSEYLPH